MKPEKSKVDVYTILIIGAGIVIAGLVIFLLVSLLRAGSRIAAINLGQSRKYNLQPGALFLAGPVNTFSGKVSAVNKNSITVVVNGTILSEGMNPETVSNQLTYTAIISDQTIITELSPMSTTVESGQLNTPKKLAATDIKIGQAVSVYSATDLRITDPLKVQALAVNITRLNIVRGLIQSINGNSISLSGTVVKAPLAGQSYKEKKFTVVIAGDTKIEKLTVGTGGTENFGVGDLKEGMMIIATAKNDVGDNDTSVTAQLIQALVPGKALLQSSLTPIPTEVINLPTR